MILDKTNEFSDSQAVTATAISTNVIDINPGGANSTVDIGNGEDVQLVIQVDTAATADGAATVTFSLESSAAAGLTSATVHWTSAAIGKAALTKGAEVARVKLPAGDYKPYLGVRYTVATGPLTAGAFSAFLVKDSQSREQYKSGFTVA